MRAFLTTPRNWSGEASKSLEQAVDALDADEVVRSALGDVLASEFVRLKRLEWVEFARHVSDWELRRYAAAF